MTSKGTLSWIQPYAQGSYQMENGDNLATSNNRGINFQYWLMKVNFIAYSYAVIFCQHNIPCQLSKIQTEGNKSGF